MRILAAWQGYQAPFLAIAAAVFSGCCWTQVARATPDVYIAGLFTDHNGYWWNGSWQELAAAPTALARAGDALYMAVDGGYFVGGVKHEFGENIRIASIGVQGSKVTFTGTRRVRRDSSEAGYWQDGSWHVLTGKDPSRNTYAYATLVDGDDVYISGACFEPSGRLIPGYWLNGVWHALPVSYGADMIEARYYAPNYHSKATFSMAKVGDDLYLYGVYGGDSSRVPGTKSSRNTARTSPGYWQNDLWHPFPPLEGFAAKSSIYDYAGIGVSGSNLYFVGQNDSNIEGDKVGYWLRGKWHTVPSGANHYLLFDSAMAGPDLYIVALVNDEPGYWLNGAWRALAGPEDGVMFPSGAMLVD